MSNIYFKIENLQTKLTSQRGRYELNAEINNVPLKVYYTDSELYDGLKDYCNDARINDARITAQKMLLREFNKLFCLDILTGEVNWTEIATLIIEDN